MIDMDQLAEAARYSDARSEEHGDLDTYVERELGISFHGFSRVTEQRAGRAVVIATGDFDKLKPLREGKPVALRFTAAQQAMFPVAQISVMDGISIGMTVARIEQRHE